LHGVAAGGVGRGHLIERGAEERSEARSEDDVVLDHHSRGRRRRLDPPPHADVRQRAAHLVRVRI
jgi:hypothetical protein